MPTPSISIAKLARIRAGVKYHHFCSKLKECTPWLDKEFPPSVKDSRSSTQKDTNSEVKIYASIEVNHKDEYVYVQETHDKFGYYPQRFVAVGTVAFPPIAAGEIWTIGFVQATINDSGKTQTVEKYLNRDSGKEET